MENNGYSPLFETQKWRGWVVYRIFAASIFVGICLIWVYRVTHMPVESGGGWLVWIGLFMAEVWFGLYWVFTQSLRWNPVYRRTFKKRLYERFESKLPAVDVFVCTADPELEPPLMVVSTVLSVLAYDYPPEKLSVYLSDDAGSSITFYALLEAANFSRYWIPYCKKYNVEPRAPAAYFASLPGVVHLNESFESVKKLYCEMENRIETATRLGRVPPEICSADEEFSHWTTFSSKQNHDSFLRILIDERKSSSKDVGDCKLPTLVYLAREKRPHKPHNFKAGAMNALLRVSSRFSNGSIILNVDCDMYSNDAKSVRDALCFLLDERGGHEIAFVQYAQQYENVTRNELYGSSLLIVNEVEFHGLDGIGGPLYIGSGCFHRREILCGTRFTEKYGNILESDKDFKAEGTTETLLNILKSLASCTHEENTAWGKEMGLKYGCPVEDVITGLSIQCQGWKSVYLNPKRRGFLGVAPITLAGTLVQHKRWSEGDLLILFSKYCPLLYGHGTLSPLLKMAYCTYCLWAPNCFAVLYYSVIPSLYLVKGVSLFPQVSSPWILPFIYVITSRYICSLAEFCCSGGTFRGWLNAERIWLYKRTTSYLFACIDVISKLMGFSVSGFVISAKASDQEVAARYKQELMEFGTTSPMFTILATIAFLNLFCFVVAVSALMAGSFVMWKVMAMQIILCGALVFINLPVYGAAFLRMDGGRMPGSVSARATALVFLICACSIFI